MCIRLDSVCNTYIAQSSVWSNSGSYCQFRGYKCQTLKQKKKKYENPFLQESFTFLGSFSLFLSEAMAAPKPCPISHLSPILCVLAASSLLLGHLGGRGQLSEIALALGKQGCCPGASPRDHRALLLTVALALGISPSAEAWFSDITTTHVAVHQQGERAVLRM